MKPIYKDLNRATVLGFFVIPLTLYEHNISLNKQQQLIGQILRQSHGPESSTGVALLLSLLLKTHLSLYKMS